MGRNLLSAQGQLEMDDDDDGLDSSPLIRAGSGRQVEV